MVDRDDGLAWFAKNIVSYVTYALLLFREGTDVGDRSREKKSTSSLDEMRSTITVPVELLRS